MTSQINTPKIISLSIKGYSITAIFALMLTIGSLALASTSGTDKGIFSWFIEPADSLYALLRDDNVELKTDSPSSTFVVNTTADTQDTSPGDGVCADAGEFCSLRAAITEANALPGADTIILSAGTYTQMLVAANDNVNAGGDFDITSPLTINGSGAAETIVQSNASPNTATERVFHVLAGGTSVTINGLTIQNGQALDTTDGGRGAGLKAGENSLADANINLTVANSIFQNNWADTRGGGLAINKGNLTITGCVFANNQAGSSFGNGGAGGAILIDSQDNITVIGQTATITNTVMANNKAESSVANTFGGAVIARALNAIVTIDGCTVSNNLSNATNSSFSGFAGGLYNQQTHMILRNSTVSGNTTSHFHAGIRNLSSTGAAATLDVINSTISNNTSASATGQGGGITNILGSTFDATVNVDHSTISGNMLTGATSIGGGLTNTGSAGGAALLTVTNSTVSGNSAADIGGIYSDGTAATCIIDFSTVANNSAVNTTNPQGGGVFQDTTAGGSTFISNSVVADNVAGTDVDVNELVSSSDYNHIENPNPAFVPGAHDVVGTDPALGSLANNGGTTLTHFPGFIVRDTIPNGTNGCGTTVTNDQRGFVRPFSAACDKGSVESDAETPTPSNSATASPSPTYTFTPLPTNTATNTATITATGTSTSTPTATATPAPVCNLTEGFDNVSTLVSADWSFQNHSEPIGPSNWFQGNTNVFSSQAGVANSYIATNYESGEGVSTISNWMLTPTLVLQNGSQLTFWTRTVDNPSIPDRLQVRLSTSGSSTNVGTLANDVGDFTTLLLDINPTYTTTGYPFAWTQYIVTISGLGSPTTGRLAFRYFVENGGPNGSNSDYIGIDTVSYTCVCQPLPPNSVSWWRAENNAIDTVGLNNGTLQNGTTFVPGIVGQAFLFDGTNDYISLNPALLPGGNSPRTLELWARFNSATLDHELFYYGQSSFGRGFGLDSDGLTPQGNVKLQAFTFGYDISGIDSGIGLNQWMHIAVTYENDVLSVFVNGTPRAQRPNSLLNTSLSVAQIGKLIGNFNGSLDEITVYNRALSSAEIQSIYNAGVAGKCVPVGTPTNTPTPTNTATPTYTPTPTPSPSPCDEFFDSVSAPALPPNWSTAAFGGESPWVTTATAPHTSPNFAFAPDVQTVGETVLVSPRLSIGAFEAVTISFANRFNFETAFDGMVLEINWGYGWRDITEIGSFVTGGYTHTISTTYQNPLGGRQAWSGLSGGTGASPAFIQTIVNLPSNEVDWVIQLRWRVGTDSSLIASGIAGGWIDTIQGLPCPTVLAQLTLNPSTVAGGQSSTGTITLNKPAPPAGVTVNLTSDNPSVAIIPAKVIVPAGQTTADFPISTSAVTTLTGVGINALSGNDYLTDRLQVSPGAAAYCNDFGDYYSSDEVGNEWSFRQTNTIYPGRRYLGDLRSNTARLSLASLPAHTSLTVSFDLFLFRSWDGNNTSYGPDLWRLKLQNGPTALNTTFANQSYRQSFPGNYPSDFPIQTGATEVNTLIGEDSTYRFAYTIPHTGASTGIEFTGENITDEYWGLDNVCVRVNNEPRLVSLVVAPDLLTGGEAATGTLTITDSAPVGDVTISLASDHPQLVTIPASVTIPEGATSTTFPITTSNPTSRTIDRIVASYLGDNSAGWFTIKPQLPDLQVTVLNAPARASTDSAFDISWTDKNFGPGTATGPWTDRVYLSADDQLGNDTLIADFPFSGVLAANEIASRAQQISIPRAAVPTSGNYYLIVVTDVANQIEENNENNNFRTRLVQMTRQAVPDLQVEAVVAPNSAFFGQTIQIQWTVENTGEGPSNASEWSDRVYLSIDNTISGDDTVIATTQNLAALNVGENYTNTINYLIPNGTFNNYFILVATDVGNAVVEVNDNNNVGSRSIDIQVPPLPDLQVFNVVAPDEVFAGGQISVAYRVENRGTRQTSPPGLVNEWADAIYLSEDTFLNEATDRRVGACSHTGNVLPDEGYNSNCTLPMPNDVAGLRYVFVKTDDANAIYEFVNENNNSDYDRAQPGSPMLIRATPPDLIVSTATAPATGTAANTITVNWTVQNQGAFDATSSWFDTVFISDDNVLNPTTDTPLTTVLRGPLVAGAQYSTSAEVRLPACISGTKFLFVMTDSRQQIFEYDPIEDAEANNASAPRQIAVTNTPPDLQVSGIGNATGGVAGQQIPVSWTITNNGIGVTLETQWNDQLFLSRTPTYDPANALNLGVFGHTGALLPGQSYTRNENVTIPNSAQGVYYVIVVTDGSGHVNECSGEGNNSAAGAIDLTVSNTLPDLIVQSITPVSPTVAGSSFTVEWTGRNNGNAAANNQAWIDRVYLSTDNVYDGSDVQVGGAVISGSIPVGATYQGQSSVTIPIRPAGNYFLLVYADREASVFEGQFENNNVTATALQLIVPPVDLVVSSVTAPPAGFAGVSINVGWTVTNGGAQPTVGGDWTDYIYLSRDQILDATDRQLGFVAHSGVLAGGANYNAASDVFIPQGLTGTWYLFILTDRNNSIAEESESNNLSAATQIGLTLQPPADLVVASVTAPAASTPGTTAVFQWTVNNIGPNSALGLWTDAVYLSANTTWDVNDILIARETHAGTLLTGEGYSVNLPVTIPAIDLGQYYVIVRTDVRNRVRETNDNNNAGVSPTTTVVDVTALSLGVPFNFTLAPSGAERYFKVNTPADETVSVTLDGQDGSSNELFTRFGAMASRSRYNFLYDRPGEPDQENLIPNTQVGTYYSLARTNFAPTGRTANATEKVDSASVNAPTIDNATIEAEVIPFSIRSVSPNRIGDNGQVTVTIRGAKFQDGATVKLVQGKFQLAASKVTFVNQAMVKAKFILTNISHGTYSLVLTNPSGSPSSVSTTIEVEEASGLWVQVDVTGDVKPRVGRVLKATGVLHNYTNVDIPYIIVRGYYKDNVRMGWNRSLNSLPYQINSPSVDWIFNDQNRYYDGTFTTSWFLLRDFESGALENFELNISSFRAGTFPIQIVATPYSSQQFLDTTDFRIEANRQLLLNEPDLELPSEEYQVINDPQLWLEYWHGIYTLGGYFDASQSFTRNLSIARPTDASCNACMQDALRGFKLCLRSPQGSDCKAEFDDDVKKCDKTRCRPEVDDSCVHSGDRGCRYGPTGSTGTSGGHRINKHLDAMHGTDPDENNEGESGSAACIQPVNPIDPNEKIGPAGFIDSRQFVGILALPYTILFENVSSALAVAQRIVITDQLDQNLDPRTFRLSEIGFGQYRITVPENRAFYQTRIQLGPDLGNLFADISAGVDIETGQVSWTLQAIDPETGEPPNGADQGLLPPNNAANDGQGFVSYSVKPKTTATTGTVISNTATIIFDTEEPITTNTVTNTLDADLPESSVASLPPTSTDTFTVNWSGSDPTGGSGLQSYDIWVSDDDGPYQPFVSATTDTTGEFTGTAGHTYRFYSIARDNAGNVEEAPETPDAVTTIEGGASPSPTQTATTIPTDTPTSTPTATPTSTPPGVQVSLPSVVATPGLVVIPITVGDITGLGVISFDTQITFDPAVVTPASPSFDQTGTISSTMTVTDNPFNAGHLILSGFRAGAASGSGALINLRFNVVGDPGQSTTLNFENYIDPSNHFHAGFVFNEGVPSAATTNGSITIPPAAITGTVTYGNAIGTPTPRFVPDVSISGAGSIPVSAFTNPLGVYSLTGFGSGAYTVTPSKTGGQNNAISALDAALIAQHVAGPPLPHLTGNQLIVADVSGNGTISSFDAGEIALYVVQLPGSGLAGNWIFNPINRVYPSVNTNATGEDYLALLMGEVSGDWMTGASRPANSTGPQQNITVKAPQVPVSANSEFVIPVTVGDVAGKGIIAYQFDLRYDPTAIRPLSIPIDLTGTVSHGLTAVVNATAPGLLRVAVYGPTPISKSGVLLNLRFAAVGAPGSVSPLTWEQIMFNEGEPRTSVLNGRIAISAATSD